VHLVLKPHATLPVIQKAVEEMMGRYPVRLASQRIERATPVAAIISAPPVSLAEWTPEKLFLDAFQKKHGQPPSSDHLSAFHDASSEV
jgi:exonuclease SbcD